MKPLIAIAALLSSTLVASGSHATTRYDTFAQWNPAVTNYYVEDFETVPLGSIACPGMPQVENCPVEIVINAPLLDIVIPAGSDFQGAGIYQPGTIDGTREYIADLHAGVLVEGIYFNTIAFQNPVTAFSIDLAGVFDYDTFGSGELVPFPLTFEILGESFPIASGSTFFGATSDIPFSSVIIRSTDPTGGYAVLPSIDNIRIQPIPEASTAALLFLGLLVLSSTRVRAPRAA